jgi:hypothetical protein
MPPMTTEVDFDMQLGRLGEEWRGRWAGSDQLS